MRAPEEVVERLNSSIRLSLSVTFRCSLDTKGQFHHRMLEFSLYFSKHAPYQLLISSAATGRRCVVSTAIYTAYILRTRVDIKRTARASKARPLESTTRTYFCPSHLSRPWQTAARFHTFAGRLPSESGGRHTERSDGCFPVSSTNPAARTPERNGRRAHAYTRGLVP